MEGKIKMKISYFIKKKKEIKHRHQTASTNKKNKSISRTKPNKERETELASDKLTLKHDVFNSKHCSMLKQLNVNRSQPSLEPLSFTVYVASK